MNYSNLFSRKRRGFSALYIVVLVLVVLGVLAIAFFAGMNQQKPNNIDNGNQLATPTLEPSTQPTASPTADAEYSPFFNASLPEQAVNLENGGITVKQRVMTDALGRSEQITFSNPTQKEQTFNVLVVAPKNIAQNADEISFDSVDGEVLAEDPVITFPIKLKAGERKSTMVYTEVPTQYGILYIIIEQDWPQAKMKELAGVLASNDKLLYLTLEETQATQAQLTRILNDKTQTIDERIATAKEYVATKETSTVEPIVLLVSDYSPAALYEMPVVGAGSQQELMEILNGTKNLTDPIAPLFKLEGDLRKYSDIGQLQTEAGVFTISIYSKLREIELKGGKLDFNGSSGTIAITFARDLQHTVGLPIQLEIVHSKGLTVSPQTLYFVEQENYSTPTYSKPVFIINNLAFPAANIQGCGLNGITVPARSAYAFLIQTSNESCTLTQNNAPFATVKAVKVNTSNENFTDVLPEEISPTIGEAIDFNYDQCAENYCGCEALNAALLAAADAVLSDALFDVPDAVAYKKYFSTSNFSELFIMKTANTTECVPSLPVSGLLPGAINLVRITTDVIGRPSVQATATQKFLGESGLTSALQKQWLCSSGANELKSMPEDACASDQVETA